MTTEETKSDGPAVLSSAMLDAFDAFAQSLVAHPHRMTPEMWPKGWLFFEAGWSAAILAEREACARLMSDTSLEALAISHERFARYSAECADMIRARSDAGDKPPRVGGKAFRCECGCNVFHKPDRKHPEIYECNGCEARYEGA